MNKLKISIITVCYNAEKTIEQTVKSVLAQKYSDLEYIIIDGASKDLTVKILEPYAIDRIISEHDKGLYDALNKGIGIATGDIIGVIHADDFYTNDSVISNIIEIFENHPDYDAVSASVEIFKGEKFEEPFRKYDATNFRTWQFRFGIQPPHPGFFIKRTAIKKVGLYNIKYKISGDFDWLLRALKVHKIRTYYTTMVAVNMRDGGISSSGINSKRLMNAEDLDSLNAHNMYSNLFFIYSKYLLKIFQINFLYFLKSK